ncbi:MAG: glycosyltransferase, partial [Phycisphaerales bacterium]|nr:glycosyltransferase [Phycisphaerales bacterium]
QGVKKGSEKPLVSILIPCFNNEDFVAEAIDSALAQTYPNIEVIVIDDGSTDGSAKLLASYGDRIRWKTVANGGACAARNEALRMSHGEYIQFLDADDLLMPEKIERQLPVLLNGDTDLVFCRGTIFGDGRPERAQKRAILPTENKDPFAYCLEQGLSTPAPLHRRSLLDQIGGFRKGVQFAQEFDLHVRLAAAGARLTFRDELLCRVRHHPSEARISQRSRPAGALLKILLEMAEELIRRPFYDMPPHRRRALASMIAQHAIYAYRNGAQCLPARAFQMAKRLDPHFTVEERPWYRAAARNIGYMNIERVLAVVRSLRERIQYAAS